MERLIVTQFLYPAFTSPSKMPQFSNQYAFRLTGSLTLAIISLLHTVTHLLIDNPYVIVISLDFRKAFDSVRHSTRLDKMAQLAVPDEVYNWLVNFFDGHSHCTHNRRELSTMSAITASIIQGSSIGPTSYAVNTGDLKPITPGNHMVKFADDTYIIIPAVNANSRQSELINVESWSRVNNPTKYAEACVFYHGQKAQNNSAAATADAKRSRCLSYQNTWNNFHQSSVSRRACTDSNELQRINSS